MAPGQTHWEDWNHSSYMGRHSDRVPVMQAVVFERSGGQIGGGGVAAHGRMGLSVNVSNEGLCLLVEEAPVVGEVWLVKMPGATMGVRTPTLTDVRWVRQVPFTKGPVFLVGLKFVL